MLLYSPINGTLEMIELKQKGVFMIKLSKYSEKVLSEILNNRLANGRCDLQYWEDRFHSATPAEDALLRSAFAELKSIHAITVSWGDNIPYYMEILAVGISYFDSKEDEIKSNTYINNFNGDTSNIQIQQGCQNSNQYQMNKDLDNEKIDELISSIKRYESILPDEIGQANAKYVLQIIEELQLTKDNSKKHQILNTIKEIFVNASGGLIATGILAMIQGVI